MSALNSSPRRQSGHGLTRRGVLAGGAGLSAALAFGAPTLARSSGSTLPLLLIDETIILPDRLAGFVAARRGLQPVSGLSLDAAGYNSLKQALTEHSQLIGISSGATLFCVERIAWDFGLRLAGRSQHGCDQLGGSAGTRQLAVALDGSCPAPEGNPAELPALQPAHGDGTFQIWTLMRKPSPSAQQQLPA